MQEGEQVGANAAAKNDSAGPITEAAAALAFGVAEIALSVSLAALLFRGDLADGLPRAAPSFVLGGGIIAAVVAWRSQLRTVLASTQDLGAIVLLASVTTIGASGASDPVATVVVVVALATLATGVAMFALGQFGLSRIVRFLPSTVVLGFLAATGWLLMRGGLEVMIDQPLGIGAMGDSARLWLPGVAVGVALVATSKFERLPSTAVGPVLLATLVGFYLVVAVGSSLDAVGDDGWLIGPFERLDRWKPVTPGDLARADWVEIARSAVPIAAMVFVSVIGVLLNVVGLEASSSERIDLDGEVRAAGLGNVVVAPLGGLAGFHMLGDTVLAERSGISGRRVPLLIAGASVAFSVAAGEVIGYVPRFVVGGILFGVGAMLMLDWLIALAAARNLEMVVSILIVGVVVVAGMLPAVGFGILAASAIFLYRYSRIDPIRTERTGSQVTSSVERDPTAAAFLESHGHRVRVLRIHGYLFFGSIEALYQRVIGLSEEDVDAVVLDFRLVGGIDTSALAVLARLDAVATADGLTLLWAQLDTANAGDSLDIDPARRYADADRAIEAAENLLLEAASHGAPAPGISDQLAAHFERRTYDVGDFIVRTGEVDATIYIVVAGSCEVSLPATGVGAARRLRSLCAGSMFGEIGFRTGSPRTADVRASEADTTLLALDRSSADELAHEAPELALELSNFVLDITANRLAQLTTRLDYGLH